MRNNKEIIITQVSRRQQIGRGNREKCENWTKSRVRKYVFVLEAEPYSLFH